MFMDISSHHNKNIKHIKSLALKNNREKYNEFVIEGIRMVKEALQSNAKIKAVALSNSFYSNERNRAFINLCSQSYYKLFNIPDNLFAEISQTESPQGVLAVLSIKSHSLEDVNFKHSPFIVYCDAIQDPGNMGTIVRTADAAGADAVILSKGCVDIYNPKSVRSTMGSLFHLPVIKSEDINQTFSFFKERELSIISGHLSDAEYHFEIDMRQGLVIVIGNEANGVSKQVVEMSNHLVKIPIVGHAESLNVGIASGILMYEVVRQRKKG